MAGSRVCKIVICNGESVIICGPAWWMNGIANGSSGAWLHCLLGRKEFARFTDPGTGVSFTMQKARTVTQRSYREGDVVPDPGTHPEDKTFLQKYWLPLMAAAVVAYFYFKKK